MRIFNDAIEKTEKELVALVEKKATLCTQMANPTELKKADEAIDMKKREVGVLSELEPFRLENPNLTNSQIVDQLKEIMSGMTDEAEGFHDRMSFRKDMKAADNVKATFSKIENEIADADAASLVQEIGDADFDDF